MCLESFLTMLLDQVASVQDLLPIYKFIDTSLIPTHNNIQIQCLSNLMATKIRPILLSFIYGFASSQIGVITFEE